MKIALSCKLFPLIFTFNIHYTAQFLFKSEKWALLVAGSNGYDNYRHQADICHAYQILKRNGIEDKNIILMMYDDIAYNAMNPTPGIIINHPNGADVYKHVLKDYTGHLVNPTNFLNVLEGNNDLMKGKGSGRVIESDANDIIFVNFVDHGAPGALLFPEDELTVHDFIKSLTQMAIRRKFRKMIIYVEACFAGSMFDNVLNDKLNIFVMTATDLQENSYACYWDSLRETYLGDVFSVNWMHQAEIEILSSASLHHLFEKVRTNTSGSSHVEEYGDLDIGNTYMSSVIGSNQTKYNNNFDEIYNDPNEDAIPSLDVPLHILKNKVPSSFKNFIQLNNEIELIYKKRNIIENIMNTIVLKLSKKNVKMKEILTQSKFKINSKNMKCYDIVFKTFSNVCFKVAKNPYVANFLQIFINACSVYGININDIIVHIISTCLYK